MRSSPGKKAIALLVYGAILLHATVGVACPTRFFTAIWEALHDPLSILDVTTRSQVLAGRGTLKLSKDAYTIFEKGIFQNKPLTEADREKLKEEHAEDLYEALKASPRWLQVWNLFIGASGRSKLEPDWEISKAWNGFTGDVSELQKRNQVMDLAWKTHLYGPTLTPREKDTLKTYGVTEEELAKMAQAIKEAGFDTYEKMRDTWTKELSDRRWHMNTTFALFPFHLVREILLVPNVPREHMLNRITQKLLEDPRYRGSDERSLFFMLKGTDAQFIKNTHGLIKDIERLAKEIEDHPELYSFWHNARFFARWAVRGLAGLSLLAMKFGFRQVKLEDSLNPDDPEGMHDDDAERGLAEVIYFPDSMEIAIRIGPKVYHYGWDGLFSSSMVRIDSINHYRTLVREKGDHVRFKIKMTPAEIAQLREHLEDQRNRNILTLPPTVGTPTGAANKDLAKFGIGLPTVLDRSPSTAIPLMKVRALMENLGIVEDRIQDIVYASADGNGRSAEGLAWDGAFNLYSGSQPLKAYLLYPIVDLFPKGEQQLHEADKIERISEEEARKRDEAALPWPDDVNFTDAIVDGTPEQIAILKKRYKDWLEKKAK